MSFGTGVDTHTHRAVSRRSLFLWEEGVGVDGLNEPGCRPNKPEGKSKQTKKARNERCEGWVGGGVGGHWGSLPEGVDELNINRSMNYRAMVSVLWYRCGRTRTHMRALSVSGVGDIILI